MMNEFDYEVYQRKRIASGDRHRKRGSKSKYCGLPCDHMTQAQWKKQNGEVKVMNLNEPMDWAQFKQMPKDLQKEYIEKCVERFGMSMKDFSAMLGISTPTWRTRCQELCVTHLFSKGARKSDHQNAAYAEWRGWNELGTEAAPTQAPVPTQEPERRTAVQLSTHLDVEWSGDVNLVEVLQLVHEFANGNHIRLRVVADK